MSKITALVLFALAASVSACSSGGQSGFVDDVAAPSESAADVSNPMTTEEVVETIKEDIVARETEVEVPVVPTDGVDDIPHVEAALIPDAASGLTPETPDEDLPEVTTGDLPEGTGETAQAPEDETAPLPEDVGIVDQPASVGNVTFTPSNPGQVLVNGQQEYEANYGLSATAEPYTPPQEYESPGFSATYTPHQPESKRRVLPNTSIHCIVTDCE